jgi:hypothetical protein
LQYRLPGLYDELRRGRPSTIEDEQVAALLKRTLSRKPTHPHVTQQLLWEEYRQAHPDG